MSGVAVTRLLLANSPYVFTAVPTSSVFAGVIPQNTSLPCVGITEVSSSDRSVVKGYRENPFLGVGVKQPTTRTTSLVQVTVLAANYVQLKTVMKQLRAALRDFAGDLSPFFGCTVRLEHQGPDLETQEEIVMQTQDVRVTFHESIQ